MDVLKLAMIRRDDCVRLINRLHDVRARTVISSWRLSATVEGHDTGCYPFAQGTRGARVSPSVRAGARAGPAKLRMAGRQIGSEGRDPRTESPSALQDAHQDAKLAQETLATMEHTLRLAHDDLARQSKNSR